MFHLKSSRRRGARAGTASIEFAVLAPVLVVLLFGGVDYGIFVAQTSWLAAATRAGLEYVRATNCLTSTVTLFCGPAADSFVKFYTTNPGVSANLVAATSAPYCTCVDGDPTVVKSLKPCPPTGSISPCLATNPSDPRVFVYDQLTSTDKNYKPLFKFGYFGKNSMQAIGIIRSQ
jgi:Flp pilus assembly protein TadG